ncbi:LRR receptor-like serine threonine-protein kinase [Seminavis robusta]|uniref:LRR receptor-like serine threonine-protein kinase n=1 Tax=Seminavis robusta TaxID=568900 RepID=A0A9N8DME6_9STRA|nr:LRR receptor-like serine threonine-protein kinase [Seminavis robusta]|eukprot:Sro242_g096550.1 LRR receptor-like serine threonine-protein kinase (858) ;mRNA; r:11952-14702
MEMKKDPSDSVRAEVARDQVLALLFVESEEDRGAVDTTATGIADDGGSSATDAEALSSADQGHLKPAAKVTEKEAAAIRGAAFSDEGERAQDSDDDLKKTTDEKPTRKAPPVASYPTSSREGNAQEVLRRCSTQDRVLQMVLDRDVNETPDGVPGKKDAKAKAGKIQTTSKAKSQEAQQKESKVTMNAKDAATLRTTQLTRASSEASQPGGYSVRSSGTHRLDSWTLTVNSSQELSSSHHTMNNNSSSSHHTVIVPATIPNSSVVESIAEARPVTDEEEAIVGTAQEVTEQAPTTSHAKLQTRKTICHIAVGATCLLALIVLLGLVFGINNNKGEPAPTMDESPTISAAPTAAPTILADTWEGLLDTTRNAILDNPHSPQALAYQWVLNDPNRTVYPEWKILQRFAMATFYYSTGGQNWNLQDDWLSYHVDECSWYFRKLVGGAENFFLFEGNTEEVAAELQFRDTVCDANGRYLHLVFTENNMDGSIPPEIYLLRDSLLYLEVGSNENLRGMIPSEIGLLTKLRKFYADRNLHTGQIPTEIGQLTLLQELEIGHNTFTGSIPSEIGNMQALSILSLRWCKEIAGTLPTELYRLTNMVTFHVHGLNSLQSGKLLPEIGQMTKLEKFWVYDIPFHSSIPTEIGLLSDMNRLNLWNCSITGSLPSELFRLTHMKRLDIDDNSLTGTIPTEFGLFPSLTMAWMNGNSFTGTLPSSIFENWGQLSYLKLHNNNLEGPLPSQLGLLTSLNLLWLAHNEFSGSIPSELGLLNNVTELFLHDTGLTGSIPESFKEMAGLEALTVSNTSLTGSIPNGLCENIWDMTYTCNEYFGGLYSFCEDMKRVNFTCSSTDLCGCDACGACN